MERGIADFDIAFGFECYARALHLAGDTEKRNGNLKLAIVAVDGIKEDGDREFFVTDLKKAPGYDDVSG